MDLSLQCICSSHSVGVAKTGSMNMAYQIAICVGAHSTANTMLSMRKLSRNCFLTKIDGGVPFVMDTYSSLHNFYWTKWDNNTTEYVFLSRTNSFTYPVVPVTCRRDFVQRALKLVRYEMYGLRATCYFVNIISCP